MSRSFRKQPFQAICSHSSAKQDKQLAARGMRRGHNRAVRTANDYENFLLPHRYECAWNNTYCWNRDGSQMWRGLTKADREYWYDGEAWPPLHYLKMMRK